MSESLHIQVGDKHIIDFSQVQMVEKCVVQPDIDRAFEPALKIMWKPEANRCETFKEEGVMYIEFKTEKERDGYFWSIQNLLHQTFRKRFIEDLVRRT